MSEQIYYVDNSGNPTGEVSEKLTAHGSDTKLHAAFSCYVFNQNGKFLVTKRAGTKKVWPGVWTNSVCGHPAPGERRESAIVRRLDFELGMKAGRLEAVLESYIYKTPPYDGIVEHEFCPVYVTVTEDQPAPNPDEVSEYEWVDWDWYVAQCEGDGDDYSDPHSANVPKWSWWCKDQLKQLKNNDKFQEFIKNIA